MKKSNIHILQKQVIPNITPKRKYIKKSSIDTVIEPKTEVNISSDVVDVIENNDDNNIQNKRVNNLIKAREARKENLNNKENDKEQKINDLVETITKEKINNIILKSDKLKQKLIKLI
jgi:hypothetical protein